jgi:hypothetical protein
MRRCSFLPTGILLAGALGCSSTSRETANLLTNPGFEGLDGFRLPEGSCERSGIAYYAYDCIPEIEPPTWWYPFWNAGPTPVNPEVPYRRPEFRVYHQAAGPHHPHKGKNHLVFFGFYGAIDAGINQQVEVEPGRTYAFSFQAFAWSNCRQGTDNVSGAGCHDFKADQAVFHAGIDPTGGTDYTSPGIVWSDGRSIYDHYEPVTVTTEARSSTITVFIRCTFWHNYIQHNDAHVDSAALVRVK